MKLIKRYKAIFSGVTPILQSRRATEEEQPKPRTKETDKQKFDKAKYWDKKIGYYQPADQIKTVLILASHRVKVPGEGNAKYSKYVKPGLIITPEKIPHKNQKEVEMHKFPTVNRIGGRENQVWSVVPKISNWELEFQIDNLLPEIITDEVIKEFLEAGGLLFGLGALRPERGRNYGRYELKEFKEIK